MIHFFACRTARPTAPGPPRRRPRADRARRARPARRGRLRVRVVAAVARRAGVATGTVYRHFPSKADLFAEVFRRASQREVDACARPPRRAGRRERLAGCVEAFVRRALAEPVRAYALIAEPVDPAVEAERLTFRRAYADLFAAILHDGIAAASCPPRTSPGRGGDRRRARRGAGRPARPRATATPTRSSPACSPSSCPPSREPLHAHVTPPRHP